MCVRARVFVCTRARAPTCFTACCMAVTEQLSGICCLLCEFPQVTGLWWQVPLPDEPPCRPFIPFLIGQFLFVTKWLSRFWSWYTVDACYIVTVLRTYMYMPVFKVSSVEQFTGDELQCFLFIILHLNRLLVASSHNVVSIYNTVYRYWKVLVLTFVQ